MEPVALTTSTELRDPAGDIRTYDDSFEIFFRRLNGEYQAAFGQEFHQHDELSRIDFEQTVLRRLQQRLAYMYGRGDSLGVLAKRLDDDLPFIEVRTASRRQRWAEFRREPLKPEMGYVYTWSRGEGLSYAAMAWLLLEDRGSLQRLSLQFHSGLSHRLYVLDLLFKAALPEWKIAEHHVRKGEIERSLPWADALARALAVPAEKRPAAMAGYMRDWCRLMKPFGWKPVRDFSPEAADKRGELESLFVDFAFEAALAVCAYDIDDSSFRDHPYYPRDLVDHYRTHIRHTRDAWRGEGVGAGVPVQAPPLPQRADLAKSKRKGLARWLELVADGNGDAVEAVLDEHGKARKVADVAALTCLLSEHDIGVHADLRDDDTLLSQLDQLAQDRGLGEFVVASDSPAGTAAAGFDRCEALMQEGVRWFGARDHHLLVLDTDADAWAAVVVRAAYADELHALGKALGIPLTQ